MEPSTLHCLKLNENPKKNDSGGCQLGLANKEASFTFKIEYSNRAVTSLMIISLLPAQNFENITHLKWLYCIIIVLLRPPTFDGKGEWHTYSFMKIPVEHCCSAL